MIVSVGRGAGQQRRLRPQQRFLDNDVEAEQQMLDILVRLSHALGTMTERGRGAVVSVSSIASFLPRSGHRRSLGEQLQRVGPDHASCRVQVWRLCPGFVKTEF
ncbi:hypothetical protein [Nocardioides alcanivorans]|uniref:hypothetical protein n=1 Tax=Nocardioides alcanivorans TaxID=2897352 RepID=UPI001F3FD3A9|nr:hypothetical protein [Nocardioides alcanivorans]